MLRLLLIAIASLLSLVPLLWFFSWVLGSDQVGAAFAMVGSLLLVPVVLLLIWRAPSAGSKCPEGTGLYPECLYVLTVTEAEIACTCPKGLLQRIGRSELKEVAVVTNDSGPWGADVWWHFTGSGQELAFPGGATGEDKVVEWVQQLPSFDNEQFIEAMGSTGNRRFVCWQAKSA